MYSSENVYSLDTSRPPHQMGKQNIPIPSPLRPLRDQPEVTSTDFEQHASLNTMAGLFTETRRCEVLLRSTVVNSNPAVQTSDP